MMNMCKRTMEAVKSLCLPNILIIESRLKRTFTIFCFQFAPEGWYSKLRRTQVTKELDCTWIKKTEFDNWVRNQPLK